jgi:hypothetical protein
LFPIMAGNGTVLMDPVHFISAWFFYLNMQFIYFLFRNIQNLNSVSSDINPVVGITIEYRRAVTLFPL